MRGLVSTIYVRPQTPTIVGSQTLSLSAEFRQELQYMSVNGKEIRSVHNSLVMIAVEGDVRDHLLMLTYPSMPGTPDPELEQDLKYLNELVNSFRPIKVANPEEARLEIARKAEEAYQEFLAGNATTMFTTELTVALLRLAGLDFLRPEVGLPSA